VQGTVQGVGFRPFVYRLARELGLSGYVLNDARGVLLEIEGEPRSVERFIARLHDEAPPLAVIERVSVEPLASTGEVAFRILASEHGGNPDAPVTPDSATCEACLSELFDPTDRRYRYPFINCTNCGPRFTIVRGVPYDRAQTTMAPFQMCEQCAREYDDPGDRRFHAQPNACARCGPRVWLHGIEAVDPIGELARRLRAGQIAAIKGIGGFHLACDAADERAVAALRARKHREDKPFALIVADIASASALVSLDPSSIALLRSPARPIVLAPRRLGNAVAASVAPLAPELGVMLPYSPLHHLLLDAFAGPLVMTSGNVSDEPIAFEDRDALERLAPLADVFLLHDRAIHARTDDSVVRSGAVIRRSRGYVPARLELPVPTDRPLLACGAEQKNTFAVAKGSYAWVSHHIGDLEHYAALSAFRDGVRHFERLFAVAPELVAHDLHPDYLSTAYALERNGVEHLGVQHHHAHLAACLAEHGLTERALGVIFDGTGYGTDGTIWGGELLVGDLRGFVRAGQLAPVRLPGGARAVREPWRMACAWLTAAAGEDPEPPPPLAGLIERRLWSAVSRLAATGLSSPVTSSIGRLFDAVAALCGVRPTVNYEGQAAVELEALADPGEHGRYPLELDAGAERLLLDPRETIRAIVSDLAGGASVGRVSARFHNALAAATVEACIELAGSHDVGLAVLSGGSFQNQILLDRVARGLEQAGLRVLVPRRLPANDGGIAFGQAAVAAAQMAATERPAVGDPSAMRS
jgi:hydrogenase maturation protein HypF